MASRCLESNLRPESIVGRARCADDAKRPAQSPTATDNRVTSVGDSDCRRALSLAQAEYRDEARPRL
jgi:hypothetical protein